MFRYMKYGPYICIAFVLAILFVLWAFWGGRNYEFVGLAPLSPDTCGSYTGSVYHWGNITPATGYDPIKGNSCVPVDGACLQETNNSTNQNNQDNNLLRSDSESLQGSSVIIDNTPVIPEEFISSRPDYPICAQEQLVEPSITPIQLPLLEGVPIILDSKPQYNSSLRNLPQIRNPTSFQIQASRQGRDRGRGRPISKGERLCCQTMERIYGVPFRSIWPDWLKNPETGENLELDCYNDELKIAVEYNGEQHYKWPNFTNQSYQQFMNQVRRDTLKLDLCDRNGVYLIVVPYNVPHENIPSYIMSHLPETIQKRLQEEKTLSNIISSS